MRTEEQPIATRGDVELRWRHRADAELRFPDGAAYAWVAGEASSMRALRRHLLADRRLPPSACASPATGSATSPTETTTSR